MGSREKSESNDLFGAVSLSVKIMACCSVNGATKMKAN